jgi:hypothetical protein
MLMRFPEQHVSIAVLCNRGDSRHDAAEKVADVVLGDVFRAHEPGAPAAPPAAVKPAALSEPSGDVKRFAGLYFSEEAQRVLRVQEQGGGLVLVAGRPRALRPIGPGRFEMEGSPVVVELDGERLKLTVLNMGQDIFQRVTSVEPSAVSWERLLGTYYSAELETSVRILMKDGKPVLKGRGIANDPLEPSFTDAFTTPGRLLLRFTRDAGGQPAGFDLSAHGIAKIRFERR